jgi:RNA polymerase sigma-70 factor (ECF subfamily)
MRTKVDITQILQSADSGDSQARADLVQAVYHDLRALAGRKMSNERQDHTLSATALVNEVSMKILSEGDVPTASRGQFFAYASKAMRNFLIDHARTRGRQKRGGDRKRVLVEEAMIACDQQSEDLLALNEALELLGEIDARKAQVVEMRYFGGMSLPEVATALDVSVATVKRDWDVAKTWLLSRLV